MRKIEPLDYLLNIGARFTGLTGGDKQRARFEDATLRRVYDVKNVYIEKSPGHHDAAVGPSVDDEPTLYYRPPAWPVPRTVALYAEREVAALRSILTKRVPDVLFVRYIAGTPLVPRVLDLLPQTKIVIDADMLVSRIAQQAWRQNRSFRNRYYLFSAWRDSQYERWLFNQPFLFFMSNDTEVEHIYKHVRSPDAKSEFVIIPNPMPSSVPDATAATDEVSSENYILFHGVLNSAVNVDAFRYLAKDIYPRIAATLDAHDAYIHVVGRAMTPEYETLRSRLGCDRIRLVGEVDDIGQVIRLAKFCLAPLRMGSGTKTRILEVAAYGKAVLTTPMGSEGMCFDKSEIVVRDSADGIATAVAQLLADEALRESLARNLQCRSLAVYSERAIADRMLEAIARFGPLS